MSPCSQHLSEHYQRLVRCMAQALEFDFAVIGIQTENPDYIETLAIYNFGEPGKLKYCVIGTPCEIAASGEICVVASDAQLKFPEASTLADVGATAYAGAPFADAITGRRGIVAGISRKPITDVQRITTLITTFASSAETARQCEAAYASHNRFIASISHEIRTPLTGIIGHAELLSDPQTTPEEHAAHARTITDSGNQLLSLISDFLDTTKINSGAIRIDRAQIDPRNIVDNVVALHSAKAQKKSIALTCNYANDLPESITTDRTRVTQILGNLIDNAIKHTDTGSVTVETTHDPENYTIRFRVSDTGRGIPPHRASMIFEPFAQIDEEPNPAHNGTGLGLSISSQLAELLDGSLALESSSNKGSTFVLTIDTGHATTPTLPVEHPDAVTFQDVLAGRSVLLVEDAEVNRRLFSTFLQRAGASVTTATHGGLALQAIERNAPFDLIIMDIEMPVMDGFATTRAIRDRGIQTPILALTANAFEGDESRCIKAGCTAYLVKPTPRDDFIRTCSRLLYLSAAA